MRLKMPETTNPEYEILTLPESFTMKLPFGYVAGYYSRTGEYLNLNFSISNYDWFNSSSPIREVMDQITTTFGVNHDESKTYTICDRDFIEEDFNITIKTRILEWTPSCVLSFQNGSTVEFGTPKEDKMRGLQTSMFDIPGFL